MNVIIDSVFSVRDFYTHELISEGFDSYEDALVYCENMGFEVL